MAQSLDRIAEEIAETFIDGNISDAVALVCTGEKKAVAALTAMVMLTLYHKYGQDEADRFAGNLVRNSRTRR